MASTTCYIRMVFLCSNVFLTALILAPSVLGYNLTSSSHRKLETIYFGQPDYCRVCKSSKSVMNRDCKQSNAHLRNSSQIAGMPYCIYGLKPSCPVPQNIPFGRFQYKPDNETPNNHVAVYKKITLKCNDGYVPTVKSIMCTHTTEPGARHATKFSSPEIPFCRSAFNESSSVGGTIPTPHVTKFSTADFHFSKSDDRSILTIVLAIFVAILVLLLLVVMCKYRRIRRCFREYGIRMKTFWNTSSISEPAENTSAEKGGPKNLPAGQSTPLLSKLPQDKSQEPDPHTLPQDKSQEPDPHTLPQDKSQEPDPHTPPQDKSQEPEPKTLSELNGPGVMLISDRA